MEKIYRQEFYEVEQALRYDFLILHDHGQLPGYIFRVKIATVGSLSGLLKGFSKSVSNFKGAS
jgi:hypothetical protein